LPNLCKSLDTTEREPLIPFDLPDYPWQKIGSNLFFFNEANYLLAVDYFSRYIEAIKLIATTSQSIIEGLKSMFLHHGIPETIISDNGPQYSSQKFADFASLYNFCHITSSPHYPQSNRQAERAVQILKKLLKASDDPYLALLTYRTTPLPWCNLSPAQLLMGCSLRSTLPQVEDQCKPQWQYFRSFKELNAKFKLNQKMAYDKGH